MNRLQLTLVAVTGEWEKFREGLKHFSASHTLSKQDEYFLILICEEWFFNIMQHGFPSHHQKPASDTSINITVQLIEPNKIKIDIDDEGIPFNPFSKGAKAIVSASIEQDLGGLGLHFIINQLDEYSYEYSHNRNKATMYYAINKKENNDERID